MNPKLIYLLLLFNLLQKILCEFPFFLKSLQDSSFSSVTPCENFYEFSCSQWLKKVSKPTYEPVWNPWVAASHAINRRLSTILDDVSITDPARIFYESCKKQANHDRDLKTIVNNLGGFPLIGRDKLKKRFDWFAQVAVITKHLRIHPILKIHPGIDYKNPTRFILYVEPGNLVFPQYILTNPRKYPVEIQAYVRWINETIKYLYGKTVNIERVREIVRFEIRLARLMQFKSKNERIQVAKLEKPWKRKLKMFNAANQTVALKNNMYFRNLSILMRKTDSDVIENYLIWYVIKDLSRDASGFLRNLSFLVDKAILKVEKDFDRKFECVGKTVEYFSPVLVPQYLKKYVKSESFVKIREMFESIKEEFVNLIKNNRWLSDFSKNKIAEKLKNVKAHLGFPRRISESNVNMSENYFLNVLKMKRFLTEEDFSKLGTNVTQAQWPCTAFEVNAYYSVLQNAIFIPLGLFEPPFFHLERPTIFNFGALGSLIGHELSHSLDPSGILGDKNGKITQWLPNEDLKTYKNKIKCRGNFSNTLSETIADDVGVKVSLQAFSKVNQKRETLEKFFISFAQMWCEVSEDTDVFANEEHAPPLNRVTEALKTSKRFAETFNCDFNKDICEIW